MARMSILLFFLFALSGSKIGPMVSASQRKVVSSHVESAIAEGATCLLGGPAEAERLAGALPHGHFYPATVLSGVPQDGGTSPPEETSPGRAHRLVRMPRSP